MSHFTVESFRPTLARLYWIAAQLRSGEKVNCAIAAAHFETCSRTIWRDIEFLRDRLRYEVEYDRPSHSYILVRAPEPML